MMALVTDLLLRWWMLPAMLVVFILIGIVIWIDARENEGYMDGKGWFFFVLVSVLWPIGAVLLLLGVIFGIRNILCPETEHYPYDD